MPVTGNVSWDARLKDFKGRDTDMYVRTIAATARTCADCERPLRPGEPLSLIVDMMQGEDYDVTGYREYQSFICHRTC